MQPLNLKEDSRYSRFTVRNLTREIDILESQYIRASVRGAKRKDVAAMRAKLSSLTARRASFFAESV